MMRKIASLLWIIFLACGQMLAQEKELILKNADGEPIAYAVVEAGVDDQLFISNLEGKVWLPNLSVNAEIKIRHLTYKDTLLRWQGESPFVIYLKYAIEDLGDAVEIKPTDEKNLLKAAIRNFQEGWLTRPSMSLAQAHWTITNAQGEELSYTHDFGLYIFQGLLDRSKGDNEWAIGAHNGLYPQERRKWQRTEELEGLTYWDSRYNMARDEIHGFFNDVLVFLNKLKPMEADSSYSSKNAYFYVFDYARDGAHIRLHVNADQEALAKIESFGMPMPGKRNRIRGVNFDYMNAQFAYEGDRPHLSSLHYRGKMPEYEGLSFDFSMEVAGKGRLWVMNYESNAMDAFFRNINTKAVPYREDFWKHPSILPRIVNQNKGKRSQYDFDATPFPSLEVRLAKLDAEVAEGKRPASEADRVKKSLIAFDEYFTKMDGYYAAIKATWRQMYLNQEL